MSPLGNLRRVEIPPPDPECPFCIRGWRRICEEYTFEDEEYVPCKKFYESDGLVHLKPIMPTRTQLEL